MYSSRRQPRYNHPWKQYEGVYHNPTKHELEMIRPSLRRFAFEDDDFVEEGDEDWAGWKEYFGFPNLRSVLIKFLRQIRESKGYDVDICFCLYDPLFTHFGPEDKFYQDEGLPGAQFAVKEINSLTDRMETGKRYEFVSLDKFVYTGLGRMLLTITAMENDADAMEIDGDECFKTIQTMVRIVPKPELYKLYEWKFKPDPLT